MKYWIIPSKDSTFRIGDAIKAQDGLVDWRMSNKFSVGDIVFIYKTKPEQSIRYKMEVVAVGLSNEASFDQESFWEDKDLYYNGLISSKYVRFRLIDQYYKGFYSIDRLREYGLKGDIISVIECKSSTLLEFLLNSNTSSQDDTCAIDYSSDNEDLYEGALVTVLANKYERNKAARKECVEKKGYRCAVCGFDFVSVYGEIGKNFIHVHHLTPISSIGKEYRLNVDTDLVPVCPNCHYMLHRKNPPYTIEELKEICNS